MGDQKRLPSPESNKSCTNEKVTYLPLSFESPLPAPSIPTHAIDPELPTPRQLVSPQKWPSARKALILSITSTSTLLSSYAACSYSPGASQMSAQWHVSEVATMVGVTTFTIGFAVSPLVLASTSEIHGRKPVLVASAILFALCQAFCAISTSLPGMLVSRFFNAVGASSFPTIGGGVIADVYPKEHRNTPMSVFSGVTILGAGLGPLINGFVAQYTTWRWIFYSQIISSGIQCALIILFLPETYGSEILRREARRLNRWYEKLEEQGFMDIQFEDKDGSSENILRNIRWQVPADKERASAATMLRISLTRPVKLLFTEPIVFFFSLLISFAWSILYLNLEVIPFVFQSTYGFSLSNANAVFAASCIGTLLATVLCIYQEKLASRRISSWNSVPEHRLYFSCVESVLLPAGLFLFGWSAYYSVHWIVPAIAVALFSMGIVSIYLAVFNFMTDSYHKYASSALAAQGFCRNAMAGAFPLVSKQMFKNLGFGPASSILGGIGVLLCFVPWVLVVYGPQIRSKSWVAREIME